jgi:hypothetical protein
MKILESASYWPATERVEGAKLFMEVGRVMSDLNHELERLHAEADRSREISPTGTAS